MSFARRLLQTARRRAAAALFSSCVLGAAPAAADNLTDPKPASEWIVTIRGNGGFAPNYPGSKDLSPYMLPGLSMRHPDSPVAFGAPDESPGFALWDNGFVKAGVTGRVAGPRQQHDYAELNGIHDIDWTVEAGGFAEFWTFEKLRARAELRHGLWGHHGDVLDLYLDWVERIGPWTLSIGPRLSFADQPYLNKFFGVDAYEAMMNGKVFAFTPSGAGGKSTGLTASATYVWNESWATSAYVKYSRLIGDAATGPIASNLGSRNQFTVGLSLAYTFRTTMLPF
jgi:outer membrane scaffolding protein for murein synthesis (MipA/OmpV family)